MLEQVPCGTGTGTRTSIPPHQPHSLEGTLANPSAPSVATQQLRNGSRLSSMCWRWPCQVQIPLCAPLPDGQTHPNLCTKAKLPLQPWACHSPVGSTKGNQTLQSSRDKGSRRPSITLHFPPPPSSCKNIQIQPNPFLP